MRIILLAAFTLAAISVAATAFGQQQAPTAEQERAYQAFRSGQPYDSFYQTYIDERVKRPTEHVWDGKRVTQVVDGDYWDKHPQQHGLQGVAASERERNNEQDRRIGAMEKAQRSVQSWTSQLDPQWLYLFAGAAILLIGCAGVRRLT